MVITRNDKKIIGEIKQKINNYCMCPYCKEKIEVGIELDTLKQLNSSKRFPYPHIHLHGLPLHALLCYIDKDLNVRSASVVIRSI